MSTSHSWIVKAGTTVVFLATVLGFVMGDAPLWELVVVATAWIVLAIAWLGEHRDRRRRARAGVADLAAPCG